MHRQPAVQSDLNDHLIELDEKQIDCRLLLGLLDQFSARVTDGPELTACSAAKCGLDHSQSFCGDSAWCERAGDEERGHEELMGMDLVRLNEIEFIS